MEISPAEADQLINRPESGRFARPIRNKFGLSWPDLRSAYSYEYPSGAILPKAGSSYLIRRAGVETGEQTGVIPSAFHRVCPALPVLLYRVSKDSAQEMERR